MERNSRPLRPSFRGPHPSPHLCQSEACAIGTHASVPSVRARRDYRSCPGSHAVGPRHALRQRLTKPRFRQRPDGARGRAGYATRLTATANRPPLIARSLIAKSFPSPVGSPTGILNQRDFTSLFSRSRPARSPHRLAVRLRHSRSNTSTEYSLPGATQLSQVRSISPSGQCVPCRFLPCTARAGLC